MLAEGHIGYHILKLILFHQSDNLTRHLGLYLWCGVILDLDKEACCRVLSHNSQELLERRYHLAIGQSLRAQRGNIRTLNVEPIGIVLLTEPGAVDNDKFAIRGHIDIALNNIGSRSLGSAQCCKRVLRSAFIGMEATVGYNLLG